MKIRIEWHRSYWKTTVADRCRGAARSLASLMRKLDRSIALGIEYRGEDPRLKTEPKERTFVFESRAARALARRNEAMIAFERAFAEIESATREAIAELNAIGVGHRDIGELVGLSRSRVQRFLANSSDRRRMSSLLAAIGADRYDVAVKGTEAEPVPAERARAGRRSAAELLAILKGSDPR